MRKSRIEIPLLFSLLIFFSLSLRAQEAPSFEEVIQLHQERVDAGEAGAMDYYNLGTAYAKLDSLGPARLYLEKAFLLKPWNGKINQNIQWVKTELASEVAILPELYASRIWKQLALSCSPLLWQILGMLTLIFALYLTTIKVKSLGLNMGIRNYAALIAVFLAAAIFLKLSQTSKGHFYTFKRYVVQMDEVPILNAPEEGAENLRISRAGIIAEGTEVIGRWEKITLEDGLKGWIEKKYLKKVPFVFTN